MGKVQILDMITIRHPADPADGSQEFEEEIDPMPPPVNERQEDHPGMSWHPILEKWVPDEDINKSFWVDESELFPLSSKEDPAEDEENDEPEE